MTWAVFTAADSRYRPLAEGLVRSIQDASDIGVTVLDVGLGDADRAALTALGAGIVAAADHFPTVTAAGAPLWFRAMTARPFLPAYAGADRLVWIDCDAWVQDWPALAAMVERLDRGQVAIMPERWRGGVHLRWHHPETGPGEFRSDQAVTTAQQRAAWLAAFGPEVAARHAGLPYFNCGLFVADRDHDLWRLWPDALAEAFARFFGTETAGDS